MRHWMRLTYIIHVTTPGLFGACGSALLATFSTCRSSEQLVDDFGVAYTILFSISFFYQKLDLYQFLW